MDQQEENYSVMQSMQRLRDLGGDIFDFWKRKVAKNKLKSQHKKVHTTTREIC
jgi:hypothetical protein